MRKFLIALIVLLSIAICVVFGTGAYLLLGNSTPSVVIATLEPPMPEPTRAAAVPTTAPASRSNTNPAPARLPTRAEPEILVASNSTLDILLQQTIPMNNRVALAERFKQIVPNLATPAAPRQYQIGDSEMFWVSRDPNNSQSDQVRATLRYQNDVVNMWVEDGQEVSDAGLKNSADYFAEKIYPTHHKYLGSEAIPGVDNDPHLNILNAHIAGGIAGYYGQTDTLPKKVHAQSNEREMFYLSTLSTRPGTEYYNSVLAHEFAHMIHRYANARGEGSWLTEGFGELGMELNGFQAGHQDAFAQEPDLQLNAWAADPPGASIPHYGASYLFLSYQLNRFGIDYIRSIFASNTTGIPSVQQALDKFQPGMTFDDVFADWVAANFLQDDTEGTRFSYGDPLNMRPTVSYAQLPANGGDTVNQYGTDYIQFMPNGKEATFAFDGSDTVRVIPTDALSGKNFWWSGRTDLSDTTLTRAIDLTNTKNATLKFWAWYDIEDDYDFAYVSVSTDGGKTWHPLSGSTTTDRNLNAVNYGSGITCKSGVGCGDWESPAQWIQEEMDLSAYTGQKILLRFEQVTDEVYTGEGIALDDIEIPEIGFKDDAENSDSQWQSEGFTRMDNLLPQRFIVQAIEYGATPRVIPIQLDAQNRGTYKTNQSGQIPSRVVITVSGSTPVTWQAASYQYQIQ